ncbi:MAG: PD40 domain-containing protein, partial [Bacteroidia bacterium]|nr:PD40 domain-containing protein [Bacteroidia bacterium]
LSLCLTLFFNWHLNAQSKSALEDQAYDYLNNFDFAKAYDAFDKLHARYPKETDYHFKLGICALSYPEKKEKAIAIFKEIAEKDKSRESRYYLARAYHANYMFDDAITILQPLITELIPSKKKDDKSTLDDARIILSNCENGKIMMQNRLNSGVTNIGSPINTREIEGVPIITADESMMIFTYVGRKSMGGKLNAALEPDQDGTYLSDIYMSMKNADSTWKVPTPITTLNTKANDAAIALSPDGLTLFTFLSNNENEGDIFVSKFNGTEFTKPEPLNSNVNSADYWEGSCSISADGKYLYFASERPTGGFGGRDIWMSELVNGDWGPPVNMGPKINTPLDDDAPFIHPDGVTLFFSSKGHSSIGGYDIMYSSKIGDNWMDPVNMGIPLNTTEDDRYYVLNSKGDKGYFSSDRATADAKGGQDIYMVTPGIIGEKLIVGLFKGVVYGNNKPIEAKIDVVKSLGGEVLGPFYTNKTSGKYLLTFKPGSVYKLKISAEGYEPFEEELDLETMNSYVERNRDYWLYSKVFAESNPSEVKIDTVKRFVAAPATVAVVNTPKVDPKIETVAVTPTVSPKTDPKKEEVITTPTVAVVTPPKKDTKLELAKIKAARKDSIKQALAIAKEEKKKKEAEIKAAKEKAEEVVVKNEPCNTQLPDLASIKGKSLNTISVYAEMLQLIGDYCNQNVVFSVQIGAYRKPENFKYPNLKPLGKVAIADYPDGITRFTQKQFNTIREAEAHRQKAINKGQVDAWIVVFVNGTRYTLEEMISKDFLERPVN